MIKLNKDQQNKIAAIAIGTAVAVLGLYLGLISYQQSALTLATSRVSAATKKVDDATTLIKMSLAWTNAVVARREILDEIENSMVTGDSFSWIIRVVTKFKTPYKIDTPNFTQAQPVAVGILPNFPYQAVMFKVKAVGYFHELGRFIADFENQHPYMRVQNISLEPVKTSASDESEAIEANLEVVALSKPNPGK